MRTPVRFAVSLSLCLLSLVAFIHLASAKSPSTTAVTPPMGWNSWDAYGTTVREDEVKANADYMAKHLKKYGWEYIVVDIQWYTTNPKTHGYVPNAEVVFDDHGRLLPAPNRFPSAANGAGFKALADYVHGKGLKFGIHIMRGIPRRAVAANTPVLGTSYRAGDIADKTTPCSWNDDMWGIDMSKPGAQEYYNSIAKLYASWGVDFIKADCMSSPYNTEEIAGLSKGMRSSGRSMVLSLSPGPTPLGQTEHLRANANMWRISGDFWDNWRALRHTFDLARDWAKYTGSGSWPDADMLPLGRIGIRAERGNDRNTHFTPDEQKTVMSLWAIFRSPLMFGGDLPSNDAYTLSLITNPEVIYVNQHSTGGHQVYADANTIAWLADVPDSRDKYLALFNVGAAEQTIDLAWSDLGLKTASQAGVRDLWQRSSLGKMQRAKVTLKPHASALWRVSVR